MATHQGHQLQTIPMLARLAAASSGHPQSTMASTAIVNYPGIYTSQSSRFHPGLLSRPRPEPGTSFLHKLNSAYTAIGLALTLALTFVTYRLNVLTWELSRWTAQKDYLELCIELKQADITLTKACKAALADGLAPSPTFISKRWLDELPQRASSWVSSFTSSGYNAIREQKDGPVWFGGEILRDELGAVPPASLTTPESHNSTFIGGNWSIYEQMRQVPLGVSINSIVMVFWMACPAMFCVIIYLHQRQNKSSTKIQGKHLEDLQQESPSSAEQKATYLMTTQKMRTTAMPARRTETSELAVFLLQIHEFSILPTVLAVGRVLSRWSMRSWIQVRLLLDRSEKSNAALADAKHDTGTQPQERKTHRARASKKGTSRQKRKNRGGRKEKAA